jgi:UDP-glucose 4-epimerase
VLDLIGILGEVFGSDLEPEFEPARSGEVRRSRSDVGKAARELGWRPRWALAPALQECIAAQSLEGLVMGD